MDAACDREVTDLHVLLQDWLTGTPRHRWPRQQGRRSAPNAWTIAPAIKPNFASAWRSTARAGRCGRAVAAATGPEMPIGGQNQPRAVPYVPLTFPGTYPKPRIKPAALKRPCGAV
jgi:hypothetical protein